MLDVDGVLVSGRPQDGKHLFPDFESDFGLTREKLKAAFFDVYWPAIILGQDALEQRLGEVLETIAPGLTAQTLIARWFANDSVIDGEVLAAVDRLRLAGKMVFLATNQDHLRARYLMETMGLGAHVDGISSIRPRSATASLHRSSTGWRRCGPRCRPGRSRLSTTRWPMSWPRAPRGGRPCNGPAVSGSRISCGTSG